MGWSRLPSIAISAALCATAFGSFGCFAKDVVPDASTDGGSDEDAEPLDAEDEDAGSRDARPPDSGHDSGIPIYTWWDDVRPIVQARCVPCHSRPPRFGAPYPLVDYEDTQVIDPLAQQRVHVSMAEAVQARREPPPDGGVTALTNRQVLTIVYWSAAGAMEGRRPPVDGGPIDAEVTDTGTIAADAGSTDTGTVADAGEDVADASLAD